MTKLVITRGLPGSGKTTYAKTWVSESAETRSRLNRDDLREMLHGGPHDYQRELEHKVTVAHQAAVLDLLKLGVDVICDDMNLQSRQVREWQKLATRARAEFEVVDLTNVPVDTCILRDLTRSMHGGRFVGSDYIQKKHSQFIKGKPYPLPWHSTGAIPAPPEPYVPPKNKPRAILVDLDGTMALMNGRGPFDWWAVGEDLPNQPIVDLVWVYSRSTWASNDEVIFMSGRDEVCRRQTQDWLEQLGFANHKLYMRPSLPDGVQQPKDSVVKLELFNRYIRYNYDVQFVLDDRNQVVRMWRDLGLTCLQVAPGDF